MKKAISIILLSVMMVCTMINPYAMAFTDIGDEYNWAKESIESFSEKKIIEGRGDGTFDPDMSVTRAEFAKMLALSFELDSKKEISYSDVLSTAWEHKYISMADEHTIPSNILDTNVSEDKYLPGKNASRQEIAAAIVKAIGIVTLDEYDYLESNFSDSSRVNEKIYDLVNQAAKMGLIKGYEDNTLRPSDDVTRAEAVVLLDRAVKYAQAQKEDIRDETPAVLDMPKQYDDVVTVVDVVQSVVDGESGYLLYYAFGGVCYDQPLEVSGDAVVGGLRANVLDISKGDLVLFSYNNRNKVNAVRVLFIPGANEPSQTQELYEIINLPQNMNWGFYDSNTNTQIYFGKISALKTKDNGVVLTLSHKTDTDQTLLLPHEDVRVSLYKPYENSSKNSFKNIDVQDIKYDKNSDDAYAFVKVRKEKVTDVIVIDYNKQYR